MVGMDRALAGPAHSNTALRCLDHGDATKEELHALEECARQMTWTRSTTITIQRETPLPQPVATTRSSGEPLSCSQRSIERASKQASVVSTINTADAISVAGGVQEPL